LILRSWARRAGRAVPGGRPGYIELLGGRRGTGGRSRTIATRVRLSQVTQGGVVAAQSSEIGPSVLRGRQCGHRFDVHDADLIDLKRLSIDDRRAQVEGLFGGGGVH
jgi:hypothetical protein